jgi:hypothetical protein
MNRVLDALKVSARLTFIVFVIGLAVIAAAYAMGLAGPWWFGVVSHMPIPGECKFALLFGVPSLLIIFVVVFVAEWFSN